MSDQRTLGQIIREAREAKGLSREDVLARLRNLRPVSLMSIEEDLDPEPLAQDLFFLARLLDLDYPALLARIGHLPPQGGEPTAH
jgi:transcriptional regulator with XRE-family HTH domain